MGKLDGKIAVITGGSSGLGLASAQLFVAEGAYVFITPRSSEFVRPLLSACASFPGLIFAGGILCGRLQHLFGWLSGRASTYR